MRILLKPTGTSRICAEWDGCARRKPGTQSFLSDLGSPVCSQTGVARGEEANGDAFAIVAPMRCLLLRPVCKQTGLPAGITRGGVSITAVLPGHTLRSQLAPPVPLAAPSLQANRATHVVCNDRTVCVIA